VQELETVSDVSHKEEEGEIVPREDGSQAQRQEPPNKKGRTKAREISLEKLVLRLYHEYDDRGSRDKERAESYRDLQKRFADRASPGQRTRWERIQHDPRFREEEIPDEELVRHVVGEEERDFPMSGSTSARWTPQGILFVTQPGARNEREARVIVGHVKPLERLRVDDEIYHRWDVDGQEEVAKVDELLKELQGRGTILCKKLAQDVLSAVASGMVEKTVERHATYGVYSEGDKLQLCEGPLPVEDEQARTWDQVRGNVLRKATGEEIQAYINMMPYWHPYEVQPAFGLAFAAPFTPILRKEGILVPHLFNYAPESDLGKSLVALMVTQKLFGLGEISGEGIGSQFRLAAHLDSIALPLAVEEADKLNEKLLPIVKESAERWTVGKRGTKELKMVRYSSRAVLIMTGNELPTESESVVKRFLTVRFDASVKRARRGKSGSVRAGFDALKPVGFALVKGYVAAHPNRAALLETVQQYAQEIERARKEWESPQRPQAWAVVYLGLKVLEEACHAAGLAWKAPSIEAFTEQAVDPIERSTWESRRTSLERVVDWFDRWCATHKRRVEAGREGWDEIQGKDEIWKEGSLVVERETIEGVYFTSAMLDGYNKDARPGERVPNLKELAVQAADSAGIPYDLVLEKGTGQCKTTKFGGRPKRAAFVPFSYAHRPPKSCDLVTGFEPVSPTEGSQTGQAVTQKFVTTEPQVTNGHTESHDFVTDPQDILARPENTQSHTVTQILTRARVGRPGPLIADGNASAETGRSGEDRHEKVLDKGPGKEDRQVKSGIRSLAVLAHLRSPEEPLEEIAARIADELRKHGHFVDLEQVKAETKDVIELALRHASQEGGRPS